MIRPIVQVAAALLACWAPALADDRVVLIGGTLIERDQAYGYLETRIARTRSATVRNLGWSGDTVEGVSRARFGPPSDGYKHLVEHVEALKPTILVVGYGSNESFEGSAGVDRFRKGLDTLLTALAPTKARLIFLGPNRQEDLGRSLPDPWRHNADLALYRDALREAALSRGSVFVDLLDALPDGAKSVPRFPLTDDGLHFTRYGYWREAAAIEAVIGPTPTAWSVQFDRRGMANPTVASLVSVASRIVEPPAATPGGVRFRLLDDVLPAPPPPDGGPGLASDSRFVRALDLAPGRYTLKVDGKPVASAEADAWGQGMRVDRGPEFDQVEALRATINAKDELYFHRWRPQNETYLFGFRKHEQGRNAREIAEFDPLIAAREAEIARLRVPVPHLYELIREGEVGR